MLLRPVPAPWLVPLAAAVLTAGAAYCLGYEGLQGGIGEWPGSFLWSACAVLPWLALFELVKRAEWERDRSFAPAALALLLVGTGIVSVGLEHLVDWLRGSRSAPVGLQPMRRLPAIAATRQMAGLRLESRRSRRDRADLRGPARRKRPSRPQPGRLVEGPAELRRTRANARLPGPGGGRDGDRARRGAARRARRLNKLA